MEPSFVDELLTQLTIDAGVSAHTCLETLSKIMLNVLQFPTVPKFRRLRPSNPVLARTVFAVPQAELLLAEFGFVEQTEAGETIFAIPEGVAGNTAVASAVAQYALSTAPEARPSNAPSIAGSPLAGAAPAPGADEVRRAALEAARARKAEEEKERARQRARLRRHGLRN